MTTPLWPHITKPTWLPFREMAKTLLAQSQCTINGWAKDHDSLFAAQHKRLRTRNPHYQVAGALQLNNVVVVMTYNPDDGYRSHSGDVLIVPNATLQTTFANVPVVFSCADSSHWDSPRTNSPAEPCLLDAKSLDTQQTLLRFGTDCYDSYYPTAIFRLDAQALDHALPMAVNRILTQELGEQLKQSVSTQRKM